MARLFSGVLCICISAAVIVQTCRLLYFGLEHEYGRLASAVVLPARQALSAQPCGVRPRFSRPLRLRGRSARASIPEHLEAAARELLADESMPSLIWTTHEVEEGYAGAAGGNCWYNHIRNHQVMTSKNGLMELFAKDPSALSFFPKCYVMEETPDVESFNADFRQRSCLSILRQHLQICSSSQRSEYECCNEVLQLAADTMKEWCAASDENPQQFGQVDDRWKQLLTYSKLTAPQLCSSSRVDLGVGSASWERPNTEQISALEEIVQEVEAKYPQTNLGDRNVWIVKPFFGSHGLGIKCFDDLSAIQSYCVMWPGHVAQKYIESPVLLNNRKCDIRQWVLIKSATPLKAFIFDQCYFRICSKEYDVENLAESEAHLANWGLIQDDCENPAESVMSLPVFKEELARRTGSTTYWEDHIRPQIENVVTHTLKAAQKQMVHAEGCFQLVGFDFALDENYKLWLIEVNQAPGCDDERAPFLPPMVKRMTRRLIEVVCFGKEAPDGQPLDWELLIDESVPRASAAQDNVETQAEELPDMVPA